jgi:two-component system phosphate regulon response regulator OmpR
LVCPNIAGGENFVSKRCTKGRTTGFRYKNPLVRLLLARLETCDEFVQMTQAAPRILVADDDPEIRKLLARYIESQGFRVALAANCAELRERLATGQIDLIVLDVMLPDGSGLEVSRDLRAERSSIPIILLTALKEDVDRIVGLEIGADDYLGKPFNPRELIARVRAVLRRGGEAPPQAGEGRIYRFEGFTADPQTRRVTGPEGGDIALTGAEFDLLRTFLERPGRVLSRDQLLDLTRGREADPLDRSIDVLVSRLRRKLAGGGASQLFKTVRNGGYQLVAKVEVQDTAP